MRVLNFFTCRLGAIFNKGKNPKRCLDLKKEDDNFERGGFGQVQKKYKTIVSAALRHRYLTVGILLVLLVFSLSLFPKIGFKFMAEGGEEQIRITVMLPHETNLNANLAEMLPLEKVLMTVPHEELIALHTWIGEEYSMTLDPKPGKGTYKTTFELFLSPEKERKRTAAVIRDDIRKKISDAQKSGFVSTDMNIKTDLVSKGPPVGKPVNVEIRGRDYEVI